MLNRRPLVSIGLPVYNGGAYIGQALDALLAQTYENIELRISDNASTDNTEEVCRSFLGKDARVHYRRNPRNVGLTANWLGVLQDAAGEYFMWAAYDDCWSPNYVETLLACLLDDPGAALAAGRTLYIDAEGNFCPGDPDDAPATHHPRLGVAKQLLQQHAHNWLYGLFPRHELLKRAPSFFEGHPWGADVVGLLRLCLSHEIAGSDTAIMYKRVTGITGPKTPRQRVKWQCWFAWALLRVIRQSSLSTHDKRELLREYILYLRWFYFRRGLVHWAKLWGRAALQWSQGIDRP